MQRIMIEARENGVASATITVPLWVLTNAATALPAMSALSAGSLGERIDLEALVSEARAALAPAVLLELEDRRSKERLVISAV